jgi:hypothetical protein
MLKVIYSSKKMTSLDLQVRVLVNLFVEQCESFDDFEEYFYKRIPAFLKMNPVTDENAYRLKKEECKLLCYHKGHSGKFDRFIFMVVEEGKTYER